MSELKAFFAENVEKVEVTEYVVSERFKDAEGKPIAWKLKALSAGEEEAIRTDATRREQVPGKPGQYRERMDTNAYVRKIAVRTVVFPNLNDAELQASYDVMDAESLLQKMLLSGEMIHLTEKVTEVNKLAETFEDKVEEAKN